MKALIQRVSWAKVTVHSKIVGEINSGMVILLGVSSDDEKQDLEWLARKIVQLRIFSDDRQKMNLSIQRVKGEILLISQFTLFASTKKGNRPSFIEAAKPEKAKYLYELMGETLSSMIESEIQYGQFAADMQVELLNDGPVTIMIDSKNRI